MPGSTGKNLKKGPMKCYWQVGSRTIPRHLNIKNKSITRERVRPLKDIGGNLCLVPEEMGEVLNEHFASEFTKERDMEAGEIRLIF